MKKIFSLFAAILFAGSMMAAVVSGTTYEVKSSAPSGWTTNGEFATAGGGYLKLVANTNYVQTDEFCVSSFSSIKVKARQFGGPSAAQALITVSWWVGTTETVLGTIAPTNTSLRDYTISSPASVTANEEGYIKISCKGASSSKGSGVSEVTITYTAGSCSDPSQVATPSFSPAGGTYLSAQNVTISCSTASSTIYYTVDGSDPTTSETKQTYSSAIAISSTTTLKAYATATDLTASEVATATYTITPVDHAGTSADPYSVADARTAIAANTGITGVYVTGTVSRIVTALSSGKISYSISDDGLTTSDSILVYAGKYIDGANFTSSDQIRVGDKVVVTGDLKAYYDTYEFTSGNELVSYVERTPKFTIANVENLSTEAEDLAVSGLDVTKEGEGEITLESGDNEIATIVGNNIHPVAAGDVTITATLAAQGIYRSNTTTFNVHVIVPCHNIVTLSKGSTTNGSFELSKDAGEYPTCEGALVVVVTPDADEHYYVSAVVAPNSSSISDPDEDGKYTVTYAQDTKAASEINVTFAEDTKYAVTWKVNGADYSSSEVYEGEKPVFPTPNPTAPAAFGKSNTFYGWATSSWSGTVDDLSEKEVYTSAIDLPVVTAVVTYHAVFAQYEGETGWLLTDMTDIEESDVFVLADANNYAMTNNNGTTNAVGATLVTVDNGAITSTVVDNLKWNISGNATNGYTFYPNGSTTTWLYCNTNASSGSNNNMRVGTGARNVFETNNNGILVTKDDYTTRYVCCYSNSDFRGYVNTNNGVPMVPKCYVYSAGTPGKFMTTGSGVPSAIDNADASVKAVKFIENGQLFIEKNGHVYNVQGQIVK